jgi:hypothetical protein
MKISENKCASAIDYKEKRSSFFRYLFLEAKRGTDEPSETGWVRRGDVTRKSRPS